MLAPLNERLVNVKEKLRQKQKMASLLKATETDLAQAEKQAKEYLQILHKEERDVQQLERLSLTNFFYTVIGRKLEKLTKEQEEVLAARLKYDEAVRVVEELKEEAAELKRKLADLEGCEAEYQDILREKERLIEERHPHWNEALYHLAEQEADLKAQLKEVEEAVEAGEMAQKGLHDARQSLDSALGWSMLDLFGGGLISTAVKHSRVGDAQEQLHQAQEGLRHFKHELEDLDQQFEVKIEIGQLLTLADFFFDGLIVDWIVQSRINEALEQVDKVLSKVEEILHQLKTHQQRTEERLSKVHGERLLLLEQAR